MVAQAFWNGELEDEIREHNWIDDVKFSSSTSREDVMDTVDRERSVTVYEHQHCSDECKKRGKCDYFCLCSKEFLHTGCGRLFSIDGNWKLSYPICMYRVPKEITGFEGNLKYVDSCPNSPMHGMAFCEFPFAFSIH